MTDAEQRSGGPAKAGRGGRPLCVAVPMLFSGWEHGWLRLHDLGPGAIRGVYREDAMAHVAQ